MRQRKFLGCIVFVAALSACTDNGAGPINIVSTGGIKGLAYIDRNGNGTLDANIDGPLQGISVAVVKFGTSTGQTRASTNNLGGFLISNLDVGEYSVSVDNSSVPD